MRHSLPAARPAPDHGAILQPVPAGAEGGAVQPGVGITHQSLDAGAADPAAQSTATQHAGSTIQTTATDSAGSVPQTTIQPEAGPASPSAIDGPAGYMRRPMSLDGNGEATPGVAAHQGGRPMSKWTNNELNRIGAAEELNIASRRRDGTLRSPVTVWVIRVGDELYVRSVNGRAPSGSAGRRCATRATSELAALTEM